MGINIAKKYNEEWKSLLENDKRIKKDIDYLKKIKWPGIENTCENTMKSTNEKYLDYIFSIDHTKGIEEEIWNELFEKSYRRELPKVSPHWPGVGKYIGTVDDEKPVLFHHEGFNSYDYWDKQPWQKNRIYMDELRNNTFKIGQVYYCKKENKFIQIRNIDDLKSIIVCSDYTNFLNDAKTVVAYCNQKISIEYANENFISFNNPDELNMYGVYKKYPYLSHCVKEK